MRSSHRSHPHERLRKLPAAKVRTIHAPPTRHSKVQHALKTIIRVLVCVVVIHLGILLFDHFGIFNKFGHTTEFVIGSVTDYLLVGSWEGEVPI